MKNYKRALTQARSLGPGYTVAPRTVSGAGYAPEVLVVRLIQAGYQALTVVARQGYHTTTNIVTDAPASVLKRLS